MRPHGAPTISASDRYLAPRRRPMPGTAIGLDDDRGTAPTLAGIPIIGIGGINASNARSVIEAGAVGVAGRVRNIDAGRSPARGSRCRDASPDA